MSNPVFRVQDKHGRGPFRPGMPARWLDNDGPDQLPPFFVEFGDGLLDECHRLVRDHGGAVGCACALKGDINRWFLPREQKKLARLGYQLVTFTPDKVLAQSVNQLVFWRRLPLRKGVLVLPWGAEQVAA